MYGHAQAYQAPAYQHEQSYNAPVYQQTYAQPLYAQNTGEYFGPAKALNWTPTEREALDRAAPVEADRELASVRRARAIYNGMNEHEREDWDTDLWGQQLLRYDLDDQRDRDERESTYAQDIKRAELDEVWEFYKKKTQYKYDQADYGKSGYGDDYNNYDHYDKLDVRETMLRANQLWDDEVLMVREMTRQTLESERQAHRNEIAEIVARREAEVASLKQAIIDRRLVKRTEVDSANAQLDEQIRALIGNANARVEELNDSHQELVLSILESVDYYGEESDIKLILTQAGEGNIDLYGDQQVHALYQEEREGQWEPTKYTSASYGRNHAYTRPAYGY